MPAKRASGTESSPAPGRAGTCGRGGPTGRRRDGPSVDRRGQGRRIVAGDRVTDSGRLSARCDRRPCRDRVDRIRGYRGRTTGTRGTTERAGAEAVHAPLAGTDLARRVRAGIDTAGRRGSVRRKHRQDEQARENDRADPSEGLSRCTYRCRHRCPVLMWRRPRGRAACRPGRTFGTADLGSSKERTRPVSCRPRIAVRTDGSVVEAESGPDGIMLPVLDLPPRATPTLSIAAFPLSQSNP